MTSHSQGGRVIQTGVMMCDVEVGEGEVLWRHAGTLATAGMQSKNVLFVSTRFSSITDTMT